MPKTKRVPCINGNCESCFYDHGSVECLKRKSSDCLEYTFILDFKQSELETQSKNLLFEADVYLGQARSNMADFHVCFLKSMQACEDKLDRLEEIVKGLFYEKKEKD